MVSKKRLEQILVRTGRIDNEIKDIELRIEELHDIDNLGIDAISGEERTGITNAISKPTEDKAVRIADKVEFLEYRKRHLARYRERVQNAINGLPHPERDIIIKRYIENKRWYSIAGELNMYERNCRRLNDKALDVMLDMGLKDMM